MERGAFPFTALTSAKLVRHAVSIDERRAKFRVDLITKAPNEDPNKDKKRPKFHRYLSDPPTTYQPEEGPEVSKRFSIFGWGKPSKPKSTLQDEAIIDNNPTVELNDLPTSDNRDKLPKAPASFMPGVSPSASREALAAMNNGEKSEVPGKRQSLKRRFSDLHIPQDIVEVW